MKRIIYSLPIIYSMLFLASCQPAEKQEQAEVQVTGALRNVMHKSELQGIFDLSTIENQPHTYGLGPIEYLQGELLVFDGKAYQSKVGEDSSIVMKSDFQVKAPFFVHTQVEEWEMEELPESVRDIPTLESYLKKITQRRKRPFAFRLEGKIETANIHVINLPKDTKVRSHQDAHQGMVNYHLKDEEVDVLGFFSTKHRGVFTHHDSYVHLHLLTTDRSKMGHLEEMEFDLSTIKLFLPKG
ncbi:MAG: acetolactate decarboxylase [Bacteroidota bacterium]